MKNEVGGVVLQLGYTIPLQRFLKVKAPPCDASYDLRLCWDLHLISPHGKASLLAVHASSRYSLLLYNLSTDDWARLYTTFYEELQRCLWQEAFSRQEIECYLQIAEEVELTKTHGRRPVAFLNCAVNDLYALPIGIEEERREQPQIQLFLNEILCRAAGHEGCGTAREFFQRDLRSLLKGNIRTPKSAVGQEEYGQDII